MSERPRSRQEPSVVLNSRRLAVSQVAGQKTLLATLYVPKPTLRAWGMPRPDSHIDFDTFAEEPYPYAVLYPAPDNERRPGIRYHVSEQGQVMLPKEFLAKRRKHGHPINARVATYGHLVVLSETEDMVERAKLVAGGNVGPVCYYPEAISQQSLEAIIKDIRAAPKTVAETSLALPPRFLQAMYPGMLAHL